MEINNKYELVDIGANLTSKQLSSDLSRILTESQAQQVSTIIITGSHFSSIVPEYESVSMKWVNDLSYWFLVSLVRNL